MGEYESIGSSVGNAYAGSIFPPFFQAIRKQLIQNRYYLSVLGRPIQSYTYISSQNRLVRLTHHDHIVDADWERLCEDLQKEGTNYEGNIEDLFRAELYLISPITDPVRFLKKEYFLTSQQRF